MTAYSPAPSARKTRLVLHWFRCSRLGIDAAAAASLVMLASLLAFPPPPANAWPPSGAPAPSAHPQAVPALVSPPTIPRAADPGSFLSPAGAPAPA
ncbi:MAG TPA: hypothetical protein VHA57_11795, partial [Actinomycetota bacterium]|nr:hypothetical protein [Actinomycetota bacterium]